MTEPGPGGYAPGDGTLSPDQVVRVPAVDFDIVNDAQSGIYEAIVGDRAIAGLPYDVAGDHRLVLLATAVLPEFRKQGIATELIRRVLDDVRTHGRTVTIMCPIVHTFIEHHPEYGDLVDSEHPGATKGSHRSPGLPQQKA